MPAVNPAFGYLCLCLLALQFGLQPLLTKHFIQDGANTTLVVLLGELIKAAISFFAIAAGSPGPREHIRNHWTLSKSIAAVGLPALTFPLQNILVMLGVQNTPPTVFVILNQTKLVSAAVFVYLLLGRKQTLLQCVSLGMVFAAAAILATAKQAGSDADSDSSDADFLLGIVPVCAAALLSGLGSALCQQATANRPGGSEADVYRGNPNFFSFELSVYSSIVLLVSHVVRESQQTSGAQDGGFGIGVGALVPIATNALGGLLVGQITYHVGSVKKGFGIVCGILVTTAAQAYIGGGPLAGEFWIALPLVVAALLLNLYAASAASKTKNK